MLHVLTLVAPHGPRDLLLAAERVEHEAARSGLAIVERATLKTDTAVDLQLAGERHDFSEILAELPVDWAYQPATERRKKLLIADMDSTIIAQECLDELAIFAGVGDAVAAITERAMRGELDFEAALTERVAMIKGLPLATLQQCFDEVITLNPGAKKLLATMAANGGHSALVSGGFTFFTRRVAAAVGFDEHHANSLIDDGVTLTGTVARPILGKAAKAETLARLVLTLGLKPEQTLAVGDGANDLAMIEAAGLGVAYHAKPIVAARAAARVTVGDLTSLLFFQGYRADEFVT